MEKKIYQSNVIINDSQTLVYVLAISPEDAKKKIEAELSQYVSFEGFYNQNPPVLHEDVVICWN